MRVSRTDATAFQLRVEKGFVVGIWDYQASPELSFSDAQIEHLDGPLPKRIYIDLTARGGRANVALAGPQLATVSETLALKAMIERADELAKMGVPASQRQALADIERQAALVKGMDRVVPHFAVRLLRDGQDLTCEEVGRRVRSQNHSTPWPRFDASTRRDISGSSRGKKRRR